MEIWVHSQTFMAVTETFWVQLQTFSIDYSDSMGTFKDLQNRLLWKFGLTYIPPTETILKFWVHSHLSRMITVIIWVLSHTFNWDHCYSSIQSHTFIYNPSMEILTVWVHSQSSKEITVIVLEHPKSFTGDHCDSFETFTELQGRSFFGILNFGTVTYL